MPETTTSPNTPLTPDEQEKLRELTTQSWNLELAISGVAMFAMLQLPDLLDAGYTYLRFNLLDQTSGMASMLPTLAYSTIRASCYVLFVAFLANFVMRAFWVGLVGLLAVFPGGIQYNRIPFTTPYSQQRLADELGPLDRYILWLDKRCNIVFAIAFQMVFILIVIGLFYVIAMLIYLVIRPFVPAQAWTGIKIACVGLYLLYMVAAILLSQKKIKETPRGIRLNYQLTRIGRAFTLGTYKHSSYVTNTLYSNIQPGRFFQTIALFSLVFFVLFAFEIISDIARSNGRTSLLNTRHLFTARIDSLYVDPTTYDTQRPDGALVDRASIQSDVIREPYLRLFIAYPKALDTLLTAIAPEPAWSDTLSRPALRRAFASWSQQQINKLIRITVNDSTLARTELLFTKAGPQEQRGWQTVLVPGNLKTGRNLVRVALADPRKKAPDELIAIPFWYVPEP